MVDKFQVHLHMVYCPYVIFGRAVNSLWGQGFETEMIVAFIRCRSRKRTTQNVSRIVYTFIYTLD